STAVHVPEIIGYYLNEGLGASTRPGSLQPLERTVIELRYGIYDKLVFELVPKAVLYDVAHIHVGGRRVPIADLVPHYEELIEDRARRWLPTGLRRSGARALVGPQRVRAARRLAGRVR